jgi:hemerythrin
MGDESEEAPAASDLDLIVWDQNRMATGIASVDEQHQELIAQLNKLHHAYLAGAKREDIQKVLRQLGRYAETHFKHEESLMDKYKIPVRQDNRSANSRFLNEFHEMVANFALEKDSDQMAAEIKNMSARWLSAHISRIDAAFRDVEIDEPKDGTPAKPQS